MLEKLDVKEWLAFNAKLQQKKNKVRSALKEKGILPKKGENAFDKYSYFSEAQYKEQFTQLFADNGLELKPSEISYDLIEGTEKQANGRVVNFEFMLIDIDTGFYETSYISGEGIDKGDKAGYKADTGALKYYLANTFMVATGDDPEKESPDNKMNKKTAEKATPKQIEILKANYTGDNLIKLLETNKLVTLEDITKVKASELISKLKEWK